MLEKLLPFIYTSLGNGLDILSTGIYCSKNGTNDELNKITKTLMHKDGIKKGLLKKCY